jgi:hypothetical protein
MMIDKLKASINWHLESKVGNGFAFLLYYALVIAYAIYIKADFLSVASALFAGLGVQTGQRTYTKVTLTKAELDCDVKPAVDPKEPA